MKKIFLATIIALFAIPLAASALSDTQCYAGGGTAFVTNTCICPQHSTWSFDECVCDFGYTGSKGNCTAGVQSYSQQAEASRCTSIWCYPTTESYESGGGKIYIIGTNKPATYNSSTGLCECPTGYSSTAVEYFNNTVTDENFDASEGVSGTGSSSGSGSGSSGVSSGGSWSTSSYTSGNSGGSTNITMPTVTSTGTLTNPIKAASFSALIQGIVDWIINIALVLAPLVIVFGGFIYMTAAGDTNKVSQGKQVILYAVIGFIVALLAKSLVLMFTKLIAS
ncbi:MAG: pilin [Candidatus Pacebacteria bacterium]|nr:pilin [Candidatus Paceibacterota bacterium]